MDEIWTASNYAGSPAPTFVVLITPTNFNFWYFTTPKSQVSKLGHAQESVEPNRVFSACNSGAYHFT